mgnify:FL=1
MATTKTKVVGSLVAAAIAAAGLIPAFDLVDKFEGNRSEVYKDPLGIPTICRGTTHGPLIAKGKATRDECDTATLEDIQTAAAIVRRCTAGATLTEGEYNAWTSFALNVGAGGKGRKDGFCTLKSGKVPSHIRLIKSGQPGAACKMLFQWTMPGTNVFNGLLNRRTAEYKVCVKDLP